MSARCTGVSCFPCSPNAAGCHAAFFVLLHSRSGNSRLRPLPLAQGVGVVARDARLLQVRLQAKVLATAGLDPNALGCRQSSEAGPPSVQQSAVWQYSLQLRLSAAASVQVWWQPRLNGCIPQVLNQSNHSQISKSCHTPIRGAGAQSGPPEQAGPRRGLATQAARKGGAPAPAAARWGRPPSAGAEAAVATSSGLPLQATCRRRLNATPAQAAPRLATVCKAPGYISDGSGSKVRASDLGGAAS